MEHVPIYIRFGCRNLCAGFMCWIVLFRFIVNLMIQPIPFLCQSSIFFTLLFLPLPILHLPSVYEYTVFFPSYLSFSVSVSVSHDLMPYKSIELLVLFSLSFSLFSLEASALGNANAHVCQLLYTKI